MKKIKIAQIGTSENSHGYNIWNTITKQTDIFDVVGFALPENEREKFPDFVAVFEGYREMTVDEILNDPEIEAVVVETEEMYLTKYATMVAEAGKHLHMEKPGSVGLAEFENLVNILKSKNLTFSTGYMYRFNPKIKEALQKIKNGELGEIYAVEAHMDCKHGDKLRGWLKNFPGGMLYFLGCHLIDLIYQIQGEPEEIIPLSCSTHIGGLDVNDYGMVVYKYKNGISFAKTCDTEPGGFLRRQLVICGEKGTIEIKPLEIKPLATYPDGKQYSVMNESYSEDWHKPWDTSKTEVFDRYEDMMRNFAEMVRGKENPFSYDYELRLYKLLLKSCGREV